MDRNFQLPITVRVIDGSWTWQLKPSRARHFAACSHFAQSFSRVAMACAAFNWDSPIIDYDNPPDIGQYNPLQYNPPKNPLECQIMVPIMDIG